MTISCVVIDAGARYGLHPSWADLRKVAEFHMFEMDGEEAARLKNKYKNDRNITIYPVALYSEDTTLKFSVSEHQALNSVMPINNDLLKQNDYMTREFTVNAERETEARAIDSLFKGKDVHFMKLDVEGAEYDLLKGARETLRRSVLGLRSEVLFAPVYVGAAQFGDLNTIMQDEGFELLNFDYTGAGSKGGRFTMPGRFGKLLSSDAVWVVTTEKLFSKKGAALTEDIIRLALFYMNNAGTDQAIDLLLRAVTKEGISFKAYDADPLFQALHRKALLLFKALLSLPQLTEQDITEAYKTIFNRDFPLMNQFYQSELFAD